MKAVVIIFGILLVMSSPLLAKDFDYTYKGQNVTLSLPDTHCVLDKQHSVDKIFHQFIEIYSGPTIATFMRCDAIDSLRKTNKSGNFEYSAFLHVSSLIREDAEKRKSFQKAIENWPSEKVLNYIKSRRKSISDRASLMSSKTEFENSSFQIVSAPIIIENPTENLVLPRVTSYFSIGGDVFMLQSYDFAEVYNQEPVSQADLMELQGVNKSIMDLTKKAN